LSHFQISPTCGSQAGEDSLKKRYIFKLSASVFGLIISLGTQAIIPRGLGPSAYGNFNFLTNFFQQVFGFLDMGTSVCFYTKLSQRQRDFGLVSFYIYFSFLISLVALAFVTVTQACSIYAIIWPDQDIFYIYLAAIWGILTWFSSVVFNRMADAYGLTVSSEIVRMAQKVFALVLILLLFFSNQLNLTSFFFFNYIIMVFLSVATMIILERRGYSIIQNLWLSLNKIKEYTQEFYLYSRPLFIMSIFGLIINLADRWFLQYFGGSIEQGFYGFSYLIGSACFIFTGAMTPLIWRELSVAYGKRDFDQMSHLVRRYFPLFYSIAAILSCFIAIQADKVIYIMGGHQYDGALWSLIIMSFYPIHQTYGQLTGAVCMAASQTSLYSKIGFIIALIGIPVGYILIAPENRMGLNAGATGLAIKMVVMQIVSVNAVLYFNCRLLRLDFWHCVFHQIYIVFLLLIFSVFAMLVIDKALVFQDSVVISFILSGILYFSIITGLIYFKPHFFGLKKEDLTFITRHVLQIVKK